MPTTFILTVVILILVLALIALAVIWQRQKSDPASDLLKQDLQELNRSLHTLTQEVGQKIDYNHRSVQDSLTRQLNESARLVADVSTHLTKLDETNKRVISVADELKTLQAVLQNPKQRGVFGEFYLQNILANVLPPGGFTMQYRFPDATIVDAAVFLDQDKILPVDSKFPLENYNRLLQVEDERVRLELLGKLHSDLKKRIDETSKYIRPDDNTMDFALMFIPSEALYYDLLTGKVGEGGSERNLIEYAFRDKKVVVVSPTTFMAYLQTVLQGLRSLQIEKQAREIQKRVQQLGQHLNKFSLYLTKVGVTMGTLVNHFNSAHKEFTKVDQDVIKISGGTSQVTPQIIDKPQLLD